MSSKVDDFGPYESYYAKSEKGEPVKTPIPDEVNQQLETFIKEIKEGVDLDTKDSETGRQHALVLMLLAGTAAWIAFGLAMGGNITAAKFSAIGAGSAVGVALCTILLRHICARELQLHLKEKFLEVHEGLKDHQELAQLEKNNKATPPYLKLSGRYLPLIQQKANFNERLEPETFGLIAQSIKFLVAAPYFLLKLAVSGREAL